jgi:hypothetical protein
MFAKTFRNTLIASSLLVSASLLAGPAAMAEDPEPVGGPVSGVIAAISTISFDPPESAAALTRGDSNVSFPMGTLDITNNNPDGWKLDVASATGGVLRFTHNEVDYEIPYQNLTVGAIPGGTIAAFTPTAGATATTTIPLVDATRHDDVATGVTGVPVSATLANVVTTLPAGTYTDTITFTLTSKDAP